MSRENWTLEDYQREIAQCRARASKARQSAASWDTQAEELRKEAAKFSTAKLPLFAYDVKRIDCTPEQLMKAMQFLYYCGPALGLQPIWSDFHYDKFCQRHGLEGNGGSDRASDYPPSIVRLAMAAHNNPPLYPYE